MTSLNVDVALILQKITLIPPKENDNMNNQQSIFTYSS